MSDFPYSRLAARSTLHMAVCDELDRAYAKHGAERWGRHEFYAILKEEVDELWDAIKSDAPQEEVNKELTQVAAMCFRYYETGDRYRRKDDSEQPAAHADHAFEDCHIVCCGKADCPCVEQPAAQKEEK